jgi:hypothetical protein
VVDQNSEVMPVVEEEAVSMINIPHYHARPQKEQERGQPRVGKKEKSKIFSQKRAKFFLYSVSSCT